MQESYYDPIYKGCTSPSTFWGVPLLAFVLGTLVFAQLTLFGFLFGGLPVAVVIAMLYAFALTWARRISKNDEQRLLQLLLKMRMRGPQAASRRFWGAVSFSPLPPRK